MYLYWVLDVGFEAAVLDLGGVSKSSSKVLLLTNIPYIAVEQWIAGEKFFVMRAQKPSSREITPMFCGLLDAHWFLWDTTR